MAIVKKNTPEHLKIPTQYLTIKYDYYRPISVPERAVVYHWLELKGWEKEDNSPRSRLKKDGFRNVPVGCAVIYELEKELGQQASKGGRE